MKNITVFLLLLLLLPPNLSASEPITPIPKHFPYDKEKALLGKRLFFDTILSKDNSISCASCHDPTNGGVDHEQFSPGVGKQLGGMNSPTVLNAVFNFRQFWNGRAKNLYEQAAGPIQNPVEMGMSIRGVEKRLSADETYRLEFLSLYKKSSVEFEDVIDAIVEFEKALTTPESKFDRYLRGEGKLQEREKEGYLLFKRLGCISCHNGVNVGGNSFQYIGVIKSFNWERECADQYKLTQKEFDKNRYKVPSLRNIEKTSPYLHNGSIATLEEIVKVMAYYNLGVNLTEPETISLVTFLKTLTGEIPEILK